MSSQRVGHFPGLWDKSDSFWHSLAAMCGQWSSPQTIGCQLRPEMFMSTLSKSSHPTRSAIPFLFLIFSAYISTSVIVKCVALASAILSSLSFPVTAYQEVNPRPVFDGGQASEPNATGDSLSCNLLDNSCHPGRTGYVYDASGDFKPSRVNLELRRVQLALARICVSEAGFQVRTRDCELIYHALRSRSRSGDITIGIMRAYAPKSFNRQRNDNHRWVSHLSHTFSEPKFWRETTTIPWSRRVDGFREVYEFVGQLIQSRPSSPCASRVDHWGARHFRRRTLLQRGWRIVNCGETLNTFWTLPERR